jgi:SlyX protein
VNPDPNERFTALEVKLSFLEDQVEQLDAIVARQQQQMALLARELRQLRDQAQPPLVGMVAQERPPHY